MITTGHRYTIVIISHAKRALLMPDCPADFRLKVLEYVEKFTDQWLTAERIAQIEPMRPEGEAIVDEARKLGWFEAFKVFARPDVWAALVALHPSFQMDDRKQVST